jgi:hypothetical protein
MSSSSQCWCRLIGINGQPWFYCSLNHVLCALFHGLWILSMNPIQLRKYLIWVVFFFFKCKPTNLVCIYNIDARHKKDCIIAQWTFWPLSHEGIYIVTLFCLRYQMKLKSQYLRFIFNGFPYSMWEIHLYPCFTWFTIISVKGCQLIKLNYMQKFV